MNYLALQRLVRILEAAGEAVDASITALEAAQSFAQKSSAAGSGASITFSGLTTDTAMLVFEGVSHDSGSNQKLILYYSTDGSSFTSVDYIVDTHTSGDIVNGVVYFVGLKAGRGFLLDAASVVNFPFAITPRIAGFNPGSQIVAWKLDYDGGANFDAGLVRLMTSGGL